MVNQTQKVEVTLSLTLPSWVETRWIPQTPTPMVGVLAFAMAGVLFRISYPSNCEGTVWDGCHFYFSRELDNDPVPPDAQPPWWELADD